MKELHEFTNLLDKYLPVELITACYESILHNDPAHNTDHIYAVCQYGIELTAKTLVPKKREMVLAGCLMHDLGCRYDRKSHHVISYGLAFQFLEAHAPRFFSAEQVMTVATSCLEHRASWTQARSSVHSELVALADRGKPDFTLMIHRCMLYRIAQGLFTREDLHQQIFDHLKDKISGEGYMWKTYPQLGWEHHRREIKAIIDIVEDDAALSLAINNHLDANPELIKNDKYVQL